MKQISLFIAFTDQKTKSLWLIEIYMYIYIHTDTYIHTYMHTHIYALCIIFL